MTASAALSSPALVKLLETLPDYSMYDDLDTCHVVEAGYRLALGRILKAWGDRILDLVEQPGTSLTRSQHASVDQIMEQIGNCFRQLNAHETSDCDPSAWRRARPLRQCDSMLLRVIESSQDMASELRFREARGLWLERHGSAFHKRLRLAARQMERRNALLGLKPGSVRQELDDVFSMDEFL